MARKKTEEPPPQLAEAPVPTTPSVPGDAVEPPPNGEKRRPEVSYKLSIGTTTIEAAVWAKEMDGPSGKWTAYSVTLKRSYKTEQGWSEGGGYRTQEIPAVLHLLAKAHAWIMDVKTSDSSIPF